MQAGITSAEAVSARTPLHENPAHMPALHNPCRELQEPHRNILAALLRAGASASSRNDVDMTPLSFAIDGNNEAALAMLLAHETWPRRAVLSWELRRMVGGSFGGKEGSPLPGEDARSHC